MHLRGSVGAFVVGLVSLLVTSSSALPSAQFRRQDSGAVPPDQDPFYRAPPGFEKQAPGAILRTRTIVPNLFGFPEPVAAWQLLYRTTAVNGSAIATVTTIFKPATAILDRFVSYATAYDASATKCQPSYAYRFGSGANSSDHGDTYAEFLIIQAYLLQGYIVSSPDYEGPDAAFTPGHLEGHCVLDNMRAVLNFRPTLGFSLLKPAIVGHGYSGGAIATGWAAALQPSYAPELPVKGWAHGGTPANLTGTLVNIDGTAYTGYVPPAVVGLLSPTAYYEQLNPLFSRILTDKGRDAFQFAKTHCMGDTLSQFANTSLLSFDYQTLGPAVLQQPEVVNVLKKNILGVKKKETPAKPVLVYHAITDQIIPWANASAMVDGWCKHGAPSVTFTTYSMGDHVSTAVAGLPEVFAFVASAFAGLALPGCNRNTILPSALDFGDLQEKLSPILPRLSQAMMLG